MDQTFTHTTVMLQPAIDHLVGDVSGCYVDATFGRGGHTRELLSRLDAEAKVIAFDRDPQAIDVAKCIADPRLSLRHKSFAHVAELPDSSVDGLLMDIGVSSPQIDDASRGFSFRLDGPLDMRMDTTHGPTVAQWLETAEINEIAEVIRDYGEERFAVQIAKAIAARRQARGPIATTAELAELVAGAVKTREPGKDPATRTFQAFRIFINAELEELKQALAASLRVLKPNGKLVVISFHSLEDRVVKQFIRTHSTEVYDRRMPFAPVPVLPLKDVGRFKPSVDEVERNPRSRSAVMRVAQRTAGEY